MNTAGSLLLANALDAILEDARQRLAAAGRPPGRVLVAPGGAPAWDDCCDGQLYVRVVRAFPTGQPFPADYTGKCPPMMGYALALGLLRCTPVQDDLGNAPAPKDLTDNAHDLIDDMHLLMQTIRCMENPRGVQAMRLGAWTPQGPMGGCAGGEWDFTLGMSDCGCEDAP